MATLIAINCVLRIDADLLHGFYRTLCQHVGKGVHFLGFIKGMSSDIGVDSGLNDTLQRESTNDVSPKGTVVETGEPLARRVAVGTVYRVATSTLIEWLESGQAAEVQIAPLPRQTFPLDRMSAAVQTNTAHRLALIEPFLDSQCLADALVKVSGLSPLVRQVMGRGCSRATAYRLWALLCTHGFDAGAVVAAFGLCGAPGRFRPVTQNRRKAGRKTLQELRGIPEDCLSAPIEYWPPVPIEFWPGAKADDLNASCG